MQSQRIHQVATTQPARKLAAGTILLLATNDEVLVGFDVLKTTEVTNETIAQLEAQGVLRRHPDAATPADGAAP